MDDFKRAVVDDLPLARAPHPGWVTPPKGVYKINVDRATSNDGRNFGIGVIIRNDRGQQIAALCKILQAQYSVELVEAIAMEHGVLLAQEMECSYVIFGVNSLSVIQAINDSNTSSDYDHIVREIQLARASFASCSFHHLKRDYNKVAHELAKHANRCNSTHVWKGVTHLLLLWRL